MKIKRLWITEKPSAARSLVAGICSAHNVKVINRDSQSRDGFHALSNGDVVAPLLGHLIQAKFLNLEQKKASQDTYFNFLPVVVKDFEYEPKYEMGGKGEVRMHGGRPVPMKQYTVVTGLIRSAHEIVNAGDVDREGQLIVDELLEHCGVDPEGRDKPIWRLPLVSDREDEIRKQVLGLSEKNGDSKWVLKRHAALARQHCDAAVGMNGSMAYQAATGYRRASVGRVQTPVLCLVVDRDDQVRRFKSINYYLPILTMSDGTEMRFYGRHDSAGMPGFDEVGRIIDEGVAKRMCSIISSGMSGRILTAKRVNGSEEPPLPFSATVLASTVSKRTGMTPKQAEAAAQSLYERHNAISYVGTDCQFLPKSKLADARANMASLSRLYPREAGGVSLDLVSKAWNDDKVDEHSAIIPTGQLPVNATPEEKAVYDAVCKRYMAQFYPSHQFVTNNLAAAFGADEFRATRRETIRMGWKEIEGHLEQGGPNSVDSNEIELHIDAPDHKESQK